MALPIIVSFSSSTRTLSSTFPSILHKSQFQQWCTGTFSSLLVKAPVHLALTTSTLELRISWHRHTRQTHSSSLATKRLSLSSILLTTMTRESCLMICGHRSAHQRALSILPLDYARIRWCKERPYSFIRCSNSSPMGQHSTRLPNWQKPVDFAPAFLQRLSRLHVLLQALPALWIRLCMHTAYPSGLAFEMAFSAGV